MPTPADITPPATPGLFITGTDTGVGKTVVSCLIADQWRRAEIGAHPRSRVGVLKPIATGCRKEREGLVSDDAEQLAHAADFDPDVGPLDLINPVRYRAALAPAAAVEIEHAPIDWPAIARSLRRLDEHCSRIVAEGVGGVLVPLEQPGSRGPITTVLDLARAIGYPVVVVCRATLGTLNHTAMTCKILRDAGLPIAGLIVNGYDPDSPDLSMQTNRDWLRRQTGVRILATLPGRAAASGISPAPGSPAWNPRDIHPDLRAAIDATDFASLARPGRRI